MLHLTLPPESAADPDTDPIGRDRVGYAPTMSPIAAYDANRAGWRLGAKAHRERFVAMTFEGVVRVVVEIDAIDAIDGTNRSIITGRVLGPDDPLHAMVGQPSPVGPVRNPVTYVDVPEAGPECLCGCGGSPAHGDFLSGHDKGAVYDRIERIGGPAAFVHWFDYLAETMAEADAEAEA